MPFPDDMGSSIFIYLFIYLFNHYLYTVKKKKEFIKYKKFQYNDYYPKNVKIVILSVYELTPMCHLKPDFHECCV